MLGKREGFLSEKALGRKWKVKELHTSPVVRKNNEQGKTLGKKYKKTPRGGKEKGVDRGKKESTA